MIYVSPPCYHAFAYRMNPCLGSLASKTLQPAEPEEPFQPFETFRQDNDEAADAAGSCSISKDISSQSTTSALSPSPIRSSTLLSSLSPERNLGASKVGARTMGSETKGILGDVKENAETSKTQNRGTDSAGGESVIGFNGSPQICGGFRGGRGLGARASPASRLSLVDRKWLERCQVFGEMGAEEKPGAGNQEMNVEQRGMAEKGEKLKGEMQGVEREAKEEMDIERERQESLEMGRGKKSESVTGDKIVTTSAANSEKSRKEGGGKEKRKGQEEMERGQTSHITADGDNESSPKTKASKNRRKKRQREVGDTQGNTTEEGGVKKRRRGGRKKEESSDVSPSSAHGGAGKKKRSKRKEGDGEGEGEEETKGPKKARGDLEGALYVLF